MTNDFAEQLILYQSNVLPALLEKLSQQLHVSTKALTALEIGYALRVSLKEGRELRNCWVFPERDGHGNILGLSLRKWNGDKRMVPGSKRGLIYVPNVHHSPIRPEKYQAGPQNWVRVSETIPCPICSKPDWCMVSSENVTDPKAVLCCRTEEGSAKNLGDAGYLHIRKDEGYIADTGSILLPSEYPILIVEGASDVAAALDLGRVAIGRPNSKGGLDKLPSLLVDREVIVLGENDAGEGKQGMERTFEILKPHVKYVQKILPPEGIKDLRQWVEQGLTHEQFLNYTQTSGDSTSKEIVLPSIAPLDLAKQWLESTYYKDKICTLRFLHGSWYAFNGRHYEEVERTHLRKQLYQFFGEKQYKKIHAKGFDILNYEPTKFKLDQIMDALLAFCPITSEEIPCWLDKSHREVDPRHLLIFPNGYLNIDEYVRGNIQLHNITPRFFALSSYPYDFDPHATCQLWEKFLCDIFIDDPTKIALLQEWFGYNLIPNNSYEKFMMLLGPARAGKSTILDVLTYILGEDQVLATSFRDYTRRFGIYPFLGKLAATIGDVSVGTNYDATEALNLLKRITGNDTIMVERKGRDITQTCIRLHTRFTMAANAMPRLPDFARTIESRMLVIQFFISYIGKEDYTLKRRLKGEAAGILIWALEGLKRLQQNKNFTLPHTHQNILDRVRGDITPFVEFVSECCDLGDESEYYITTEHLYECWKQWAIKNGERPNNTRWVARSLLSLYPKCTAGRRMIRNQRKRTFLGIRMNKDTADYLGQVE